MDAMVERIAAQCLARGLRVGVAESCTGGMVAAALTAAPGASAWFAGGVVAYAEAVKVAVLGVPAEVLAAHGAVSAETACAMAAGACRVLGVDVAVSVTGLAGPDGDGVHPVGTVFVGGAGTKPRPYEGRGRSLAPTKGGDEAPPPRDWAEEHHFAGSREEVRMCALRTALALLARATEGGEGEDEASPLR
ncbi:MAG: CinA family protein [Kiritimatiellia bacterium]|jgi:PncC family amidohydrolase